MFKNMFNNLSKSWNTFTSFVGHNGVKMEEINRTESIKSSGGGTTYDRYDAKFGLHGE